MPAPWEKYQEPQASAGGTPWRKYQPKPSYKYVEPDDGQDERIMFEATGETVRAPRGTGEFFGRIQDDETFEPDSTVLEETAATFEKQAAYIGLVANAYGLVADEDIADFVADRSRALASAQQRQPEYMKEFQRQFDDAQGFFETAGVFLSNPRAIGRTAITQSPNSIMPLLTAFAGAKAGAAAGAIGGSVVPVAGTTAGAVGGGLVGAAVGSIPGGAIVEIGAEIDQMLAQEGVDITDGVSVLEALENDQLMTYIRDRAERKGITTASVDALFQAFGGRFLRAARGTGTTRVLTAGAKDVAVESAGEFVGEAAGQLAREEGDVDKVDFKDAALEAVSSIAQSTGQAVIGGTLGGRQQQTEDKVTNEGESVSPSSVEAAEAAPVQDSVLEAAGVTEDVTPEVTGAIDEIEKASPGSLDDIADTGVEGVEELQAELTERRITLLENEYDRLQRQVIDSEDENKIKRINPQLDKIRNQISELAVDEEKFSLNAAKRLVDTIRNAVSLAKKDITIAQDAIISRLSRSGLTAADREKFTRQIKNIQSSEQAVRQFPKIQQRIEKLLDAEVRRATLSRIKRALKGAKKSRVLAADFAKNIQDLVDEIDTKKRTEKTTKALEATKKFFDENPSKKIPKNVMRRLDILNKKPLDQLSTDDLQALLQDITNLQSQGRAKQRLKEKAKQRRLEQRLRDLSDIRPLVSKEEKVASIGEGLSLLDRVKNVYIAGVNRARNISLALNPMDVFFDIMDGNQSYVGPAHRIFKQKVDQSFSRYLDLKESVTRDVKSLSDELNLNDKNFERIGVYAAVQQDGGLQKLKNSGISEKEAKSIKLTKDEMRFYQLMREKLDSMFPRINKVMVDVYNQNVDQVEDYFPFMTDFDQMDDLEITDMVGPDLPSPGTIKKKGAEKGFTKSRAGAGRQAIRIDAMNVFLQHVDNAAYLVEMGQDIKELGELAQSQEFADLAGDLGQQFVIDWVDLLARKGRAPNRIKALDTFRKNTGFAMLGYKLSTVLVQPTALMDGAALIGGSYVARGTNAVTKRKWRQFLKDNIPEIRERVGDDPAYLNLGGDGIINKVQQAGFWALQNVDNLAASSVAAGAYMRSIEERGLTLDLTKPDPQAIQDAQLFMRRTQSSAFAKDVPQLISTGKLTGNSSLDKLIFQFQSFVINRWSVIKHDMVAAGIGQKRTAQAVNIATWMLLANMAELGVRRLSKEIITAMFESNDLDPWEDTIEKEAVMTLVGNVPIAGSLVNSMEYGSVPVPSISLMNNIFDKIGYAAASKDGEKKIKHLSSAGIVTLGVSLGLPGTMQADQLLREATKENKKSSF